MFVVHGTKKMLDRVGPATTDPATQSTTRMGSWYATPLFWRPQVSLFVNEPTRLPVLVHLAPSGSVVRRFVDVLAAVLDELGLPHALIAEEVDEMADYRIAKTANRSVLGSMNDFTFLADAYGRGESPEDLLRLSLRLAGTPCGPLMDRSGFPDQEVRALFATPVS